MNNPVDRRRVADAVRELLAAIGEDPDRGALAATPERVAESYSEFFSGIGVDPSSVLGGSVMAADEQSGEMVLLRDVIFRSVCEHHLLPFRGRAHVAYRPGTHVVGLGSIARLIDVLASRLQLQERLGEEIAETIHHTIDPEGVLVVLEASHGCVADRGSRQSESSTVTVASRGSLVGAADRAEVLALIARADRSFS